MKPWINLFIIYCLCFTACDSEGSRRSGQPSIDQIHKLLENYYTTMSERNWQQYKIFFSDDAILTTVWQKEGDTLPRIINTSITNFILEAKDGPGSQPIFEENMLSDEIKVKNNLATAWVKYEAKFGTKDKLMEWKGVDLFSFLRHDNEWKIVSIVFESE